MPLDPGTARLLAEMQERGLPGPADSDVATARAVLRAISGVDRPSRTTTDPATTVPVADVREEVVGGVAARVYRPDAAAPAAPAPTVVFLHGGGFVIGDLDTHDGPARVLAADLGAVVVSVDYGLAPEQPFPAGLDDAWAALSDVASRIEDFGGDRDRLVIGGDSAGANLATVTALRARDAGVALAAQLLVYPTTDPGGSYPSREDNAEGYFLTARDLDWFFHHYTGVDPRSPEGADVMDDPRVAPLRARLAGLAPAVVATAEFDPLRDEGIAYARALEAAGVEVVHATHPGLIHGFYGTPLPAAVTATHAIHAALAEVLAASTK